MFIWPFCVSTEGAKEGGAVYRRLPLFIDIGTVFNGLRCPVPSRPAPAFAVLPGHNNDKSRLACVLTWTKDDMSAMKAVPVGIGPVSKSTMCLLFRILQLHGVQYTPGSLNQSKYAHVCVSRERNPCGTG